MALRPHNVCPSGFMAEWWLGISQCVTHQQKVAYGCILKYVQIYCHFRVLIKYQIPTTHIPKIQFPVHTTLWYREQHTAGQWCISQSKVFHSVLLASSFFFAKLDQLKEGSGLHLMLKSNICILGLAMNKILSVHVRTQPDNGSTLRAQLNSV